ncbi:MAG: hypothetical protein C5B50_29850 [Verrucomicrobia bacterium]|nr:MAG: hypothetical protein C5B50_29850 [Verrucomicrobiota bacterium]
MAELAEADYDALVLRFFQNHDLRNVGRALGVSEDTAQKRVAQPLRRRHHIYDARDGAGGIIGLVKSGGREKLFLAFIKGALRNHLICIFVASRSMSLNGPALASEITVNPAYQLTVNAWTMEDGLPGNAVLTLAPTRDGYLWVGTPNGLTRFDGVRFVRFHRWDGLTSLQIGELLEDRAGRLWIGTQEGGLMLREHGRFQALSRTNGFAEERVRQLAEDSEGRVWVADNEGLARWDGNRLMDMQMPHEKANQPGCNSVCCASNSVWAVGDDWALREWRNGRWQPGPKLQKPGFRFDKVFQARNGQLWSQTFPFGLARMEGGQWRLFGTESGLPGSYIRAVLDQGQDGFMCASLEHGLFLFRDERGSPVALNEGTERDGVHALQRDKLGNLWVGTSSRGLLRLRQPRVRVVPGSDHARLARMAFDDRGRFWIASFQGLWFEQGGKLVQVPPPPSLKQFGISVLKPCPAGGIWICMSGKGLWEYDPDRHAGPIQRLTGNKEDITGVLLTEDAAGGFWFGDEKGNIGRLMGQSTNLLGKLKWEGDHIVVGLLGDATGGVWARIEGTAMVRLDAQGKEIERVGARQGLPVNSIRCWLGDGEGGLWMGSPMGLYWWHKSRLLLFDERHGLPEEALANMVDDASGGLWCAANGRLFRLRKKELEAVAAQTASVLHPLLVGRSAGLTRLPFATGIAAGALRGPDGRLFFPRVWDAISFNPADFEKAEPAPKVLIEEVFADGRKMDPPGATDGPLKIPARTGDIAVRYTALECVAPETVQFRYRFEGLDEKWSEAGSLRLADFWRLAPGTYHFRVSASVAGGDWADPGASLAFTVLPAWYQTSWFRVLLAMLVAGGAAGFYWRRVSRLQAQRTAQQNFSRRLIESQELERKRIAAELHDSLGQNLLVIKNRADIAHKARASGAREEFGEISRVAGQALDEVREISQNLRPYQLDRLGLTRAVAGLVKKVGASSAVKCVADIAPLDKVFPPEAEINVYRIVQEGLNNILKHSGATEARVTLAHEPARVRLLIEDNGRGFDLPAATQRPERAGGMGLDGIAERVRILGGRLQIQSTPGGGTRLKIDLPAPTDGALKASSPRASLSAR